MILGIPKEILDNETRVAAIPATVKQYVSAGFDVKIQSGAGALSQISDEDFKDDNENEEKEESVKEEENIPIISKV